MSTEKELRDALRGCLAYLWPSPEEGHTGFVDRLGMEFYRDTGIWPHFKSAPMEVARDTDYAEAQKRWSAWLEAKRDAAAAAAVRALASPSEAPRDTLRAKVEALAKEWRDEAARKDAAQMECHRLGRHREGAEHEAVDRTLSRVVRALRAALASEAPRADIACDDHRPDGPDPYPGCQCGAIDRLCASSPREAPADPEVK